LSRSMKGRMHVNDRIQAENHVPRGTGWQTNFPISKNGRIVEQTEKREKGGKGRHRR